MESSRGSFGKSRESGLVKKPRLNDDVNDRPFPQRPIPSMTNARLRAIHRESEGIDAGRGGNGGGAGTEGYHPQLPQHQELLVQYRNALAELTFNSKPIITNLTIIAGENQYAAKDIVAMVCSNILEVPSDQKLPSLYLLDSIVKNIGSDYIKYFAARLPEVYCKAFKQVDPSVHASMRHLFGTWKGVFPPQALRMIEKELGFNQMVNGSPSGVTTMRTNSQTQRPPHSIHVNPKYLERQRLQQTSKVKGAANDMTELSGRTSVDAETLGRTSLNAGRPWIDPHFKNHNKRPSPENAFTEPIHQKSSVFPYGGNEYVSQTSASGIGRTIARSTEIGHDKAWYKAGSGIADTSSRRNGLNIKHGFPNFDAHKSSNATSHIHAAQTFSKSNTSGLSNSWKNSEEEEFMWNNVNSGLSDNCASAISNTSIKDHWIPDDEDDDNENLEIVNLQKRNTKPDVGSGVDRGTSIDQQQLATLERHAQSPWAPQDTRLGQSGTYSSTLTGRFGSKSQMNSSHSGDSGVGSLSNAYTVSSGIMGPRQCQSGGSALLSGQSPVHQHPPSPSLTACAFQPQLRNSNGKGRLSFPKASQLSAALEYKNTQDKSSSLPSSASVGSWQKSNTNDLKILMPSKAPLQKGQHNSTSQQQQQVDSNLTEFSDMKEKASLSRVSDHETQSTAENSASEISSSLNNETSEPSTASNLLAAVMKSGIFSRTSITSSPSMNLLDTETLASQSGHLAQPLSGSPSQDTSVPMGSLPSPSPSCSNNIKTVFPSKCQKKEEEVSVAAGPPSPSAVSSGFVQSLNVLNNSLNPISNILSSLVAKGLISAQAETKNVATPDMLSRLQDHSEGRSSSTSQPLSLVPIPAAIPFSMSKDKVSTPEQDSETSASCSQSSPRKIKSLIGLEFKPDVLREVHTHVLRELYDDCLNCSMCGFRLKFQDQLDRHLEWHALRVPQDNEKVQKSRSWYGNSSDWVSGKSQFPSESECPSLDQCDQQVDKAGPMVVADESQCVCAFCGELFEDFYSQERENWMFKGAIYMAMNSGLHGDSTGQIVHAKCLSESSAIDVAMFNGIKMEEDI